MASRRIVSTEKTALDRDDQPEGKSDISPAVPSSALLLIIPSPMGPALSIVAPAPLTSDICRSVLWKLIGFTFAMITVPIGSYYLSVHSIFRGD